MLIKIRSFLHNYMRELRSSNLERKIQQKELSWGTIPNIVVSMTTYKARFDTVSITLRTLLCQSIKPNKIIVWLDEGDEITDEMEALIPYGITYRYEKENIKPHKKYFFAMKEYPDSLIITVDDDLIYPPDLIESLVNTWRKYPDCVCARRVHRMTFYSDGTIKPYKEWEWECNTITEPSYELFATGVSGVLYPPHCIDDRTFNLDLLKELSLNQDDVWLKAMELLHNTKVVWVKNHHIQLPVVKGSQNSALNTANYLGNKNDFYINNMVKNFGDEIKRNTNNFGK